MKEILLQGDGNAFSGQRCENLIQHWLKEIKQMLHETDHLLSLTYPKKDKYKLKAGKPALVLLAFLTF